MFAAHCLVRDVGVAGSNPATPTSFSSISQLTGHDMGNETSFGAGALSNEFVDVMLTQLVSPLRSGPHDVLEEA